MIRYAIEHLPHGLVVRGRGVPVSDLDGLGAIAKAHGYEMLDAQIAEKIGATFVFVSAESGKAWRAEIEAGIASQQLTSEAAWLAGTDNGISSRVLFAALSDDADLQRAALARNGGCDRNQHPLDPDDFGRCLRMVRLLGWRDRLTEVPMTPPWLSIAHRWDELAALYDEEYPTGRAPKLYALMKEPPKSR